MRSHLDRLPQQSLIQSLPFQQTVLLRQSVTLFFGSSAASTDLILFFFVTIIYPSSFFYRLHKMRTYTFVGAMLMAPVVLAGVPSRNGMGLFARDKDSCQFNGMETCPGGDPGHCYHPDNGEVCCRASRFPVMAAFWQVSLD